MIMTVIFICFTFLFPLHSLQAITLDEAALSFIHADTSFHAEPYPIASPLHGGPLRILFFGRHDSAGRLSVEIAARMECHIETFLTSTSDHMGIESVENRHVPVTLTENEMVNRLIRLLNEGWDIIWLDFDIDSLPGETGRILFETISEGTGLVYVGKTKDLRSYQTGGKVDEKPLDAVTFGNIKPDFAGKRGKGLMVAMTSPLDIDSYIDICDYYSCAVNAILFASGRQTGTRVIQVERPKKIEHEAMIYMNFKVDLIHDEAAESVNVHCRYRNEKGDVSFEFSDMFNLKNGKSFILLDFPLLPIGRYSLDISVSDQGGVVAVAGTSIIVTSVERITDVKLWSTYTQEGGIVAGTVRLSSEFQEDMRIQAELYDSSGRLFDKRELDIIPKRVSVFFSFLLKEYPGNVLFVRINFFKSNVYIQTFETQIFVNKSYNPRKFSFVVEEEYSTGKEMKIINKSLHDAGVNTIALDIPVSIEPDEAFMRVINTSLDVSAVIPVFESPQLQADKNRKTAKVGVDKHFLALVDTLRHFTPPAFSVRYPEQVKKKGITDEEYISFQHFLENRYTSIDNLNRVLRTGFSSFKEVSPVSLADAERTEKYASWMDTKLWEEDTFINSHRNIFAMITRSDSTVKVGIIGLPYPENISQGWNVAGWNGISGLMITDPFDSYSLPYFVYSFEPFSVPAYNKRLIFHLIGGQSYKRWNESLLRAVPWQSLFSGMNGIWWSKGRNRFESALTPYHGPSPALSIVAEEVRDIVGGIDMLISGCSRQADSIGILYNRTSLFAAITSRTGEAKSALQDAEISEIYNSSNTVIASARSFYHASRDAGFSTGFVSDEQVQNPAFLAKFSLLYIPYLQAVSDETVDTIKTFVENGGTVIADMRPAVMNEYLFMRDAGALNNIFGITMEMERIPVMVRGVFSPVRNEEFFSTTNISPVCLADASVKVLDGANVLASVGDIPTVIVNRYKNGHGIFLNMNLEAYENQRLKGEGMFLRDIITWSIRTGTGNNYREPYVNFRESTGNPTSCVNTTIYRDSLNVYIGVLPYPLTDDTTGKSSTGFTGNGTMILKEADIKPYVYDVRNGSFIGVTAEVPVSLSPGRGQLFALLPYRVQNLELILKKSVVKVGERLEYSVSVIPQESNVKVGRHVLHIRVFGPDGKERSCFSGTYDAVNGWFESYAFIAHNESRGRWILNVRDVATGKQIERSFMVMAQGIDLFE